MGKLFLYCEATEGGMDHWLIYSLEDLEHLYGWMDRDVRKADEAMVEWMDQAKIGQYYHHRLGIIVRLRYVPPQEEEDN